LSTATIAEPNADSGLVGLARIAGFFRIPADPAHLAHQLGLGNRPADGEMLVRGGRLLGLKTRLVYAPREQRLRRMPVPALIKLKNAAFVVLAGTNQDGTFRLVEPLTRTVRSIDFSTLAQEWDAQVVLAARRLGVGIDPRNFGFQWFLPSLVRYRRPLIHVLVASLFIQLFGLVTPLFFQIVVDKVLAHKANDTLLVVVIGVASLGLFGSILQYLRSYALSHTTNRIDVELGSRLFHHLMRLPLGYFETRAAGQTVARMRELENIRSFLTGQALFSAIDMVFAVVFVGVLFAYSTQLALIVLISAPVYLLIAAMIRPLLRERIREKFNRGAMSQQFLVEAVVGLQTIKAAAIEPMMQDGWDDRLAAYVKTSFQATQLGAMGQNAIQYVSTLSTAAIIYFGAQAVIANQMTIGELIAFNMIAGQLTQPILRLSQLFQDFQQVRVSVERLGDILNTPMEAAPQSALTLPPPQGAIELKRITFRYSPGSPDVLSNVSLSIAAGEVIGIVGASGSGKSTITKLVQRMYQPEQGQILLDGIDIAQMDPAWLRRQIGVVLQENLLFNRSIHDNIALANPAMPRAAVMHVAELSGAQEFIARLPQGYDTMIEERGANLSGGQRQRLAIARALATRPRILILDEATSALDYESERIIQDNMRKIVKGRTVLIVAHRLAAIRGCNRIVGMHQGRIVETGTHDELLKQGGVYANLWRLQGWQGAAE
jgi:ATP-binding cassette, subfamily B, bacterial HlyB/CyaB